MIWTTSLQTLNPLLYILPTFASFFSFCSKICSSKLNLYSIHHCSSHARPCSHACVRCPSCVCSLYACQHPCREFYSSKRVYYHQTIFVAELLVLVWLQQALQQQAHEAFQQSLSAMQGLPTHNTNQGYFGKLPTNKTISCLLFSHTTPTKATLVSYQPTRPLLFAVRPFMLFGFCFVVACCIRCTQSC